MATKNTATLSRLGASGQTVADPAEDIRGRRVKDKDGDDIGKVADLLIDDQDRKVRFLRVEHGGILGFGATASFIPVDALRAYRSAAVAHRAEYAILRRLQAGLLRLPVPLIPPVVRLFATGPLAPVAQRAYWRVADPDRLEVTPGVHGTARVAPDQCAAGPAAQERRLRRHQPTPGAPSHHVSTGPASTRSATTPVS